MNLILLALFLASQMIKRDYTHPEGSSTIVGVVLFFKNQQFYAVSYVFTGDGTLQSHADLLIMSHICTALTADPPFDLETLEVAIQHCIDQSVKRFDYSAYFKSHYERKIYFVYFDSDQYPSSWDSILIWELFDMKSFAINGDDTSKSNIHANPKEESLLNYISLNYANFMFNGPLKPTIYIHNYGVSFGAVVDDHSPLKSLSTRIYLKKQNFYVFSNECICYGLKMMKQFTQFLSILMAQNDVSLNEQQNSEVNFPCFLSSPIPFSFQYDPNNKCYNSHIYKGWERFSFELHGLFEPHTCSVLMESVLTEFEICPIGSMCVSIQLDNFKAYYKDLEVAFDVPVDLRLSHYGPTQIMTHIEHTCMNTPIDTSNYAELNDKCFTLVYIYTVVSMWYEKNPLAVISYKLFNPYENYAIPLMDPRIKLFSTGETTSENLEKISPDGAKESSSANKVQEIPPSQRTSATQTTASDVAPSEQTDEKIADQSTGSWSPSFVPTKKYTMEIVQLDKLESLEKATNIFGLVVCAVSALVSVCTLVYLKRHPLN